MAKTVITIELDEEIAIKGAGAETTINLGNYKQEALEYIFQYGFNRAHQDRANSLAKAARDEGATVDGKAILEDVAKRVAEADFNRRGSGGTGYSPVERAMISLARKAAKASDEHKYKNASAAERDKLVVEYIGKLPDAQQATLQKAAEQKVEMDKLQAELAKGLDLNLDV